MTFRKGTPVRQIVPVIEGTIESFQVDQETGELQYLVAWTTPDGDVQSKYFRDGEIEAVPEAAE